MTLHLRLIIWPQLLVSSALPAVFPFFHPSFLLSKTLNKSWLFNEHKRREQILAVWRQHPSLSVWWASRLQPRAVVRVSIWSSPSHMMLTSTPSPAHPVSPSSAFTNQRQHTHTSESPFISKAGWHPTAAPRGPGLTLQTLTGCLGQGLFFFFPLSHFCDRCSESFSGEKMWRELWVGHLSSDRLFFCQSSSAQN